VIAALAMAAMLGAVSMVIDAGVFFVIQRQLQDAADAAALAAVWYDPGCDAATMGIDGCQVAISNPTPPQCMVPPNSTLPGTMPCTAAFAQVKANWSSVLGLCAGPNLPAGSIPVTILAYRVHSIPSANPGAPQLNPFAVSLSCDAPHWFARALPGVKLTQTLSANSAAALAWLGPSGQLQTTRPANPRLVARLIPSALIS
jgi:hypothetical protein